MLKKDINRERSQGRGFKKSVFNRLTTPGQLPKTATTTIAATAPGTQPVRVSLAAKLHSVDHSQQVDNNRGANSAALTLEDEIAKKTMIFNYMPWSRKGGSQKRSIT